jgi:hypothetical protein
MELWLWAQVGYCVVAAPAAVAYWRQDGRKLGTAVILAAFLPFGFFGSLSVLGVL